MKLTELFPDLPILKLNGKEYELKFSVRSKIQLDRDYPDSEKGNSNERIMATLNTVFTTMKTEDVVNFLFASLIDSKDFKSKEDLMDAMKPNQMNVYIDNVFCAYKLSTLTDEQIQKMEVMSKANGSTKKKRTKVATMPVNIVSSEPKSD